VGGLKGRGRREARMNEGWGDGGTSLRTRELNDMIGLLISPVSACLLMSILDELAI
jgi:hypothetical protein